ncbi:hypothetical protein T12_4638 [Trichinella patagoniensis]|uniref:Uncharacterized protein n=1 Tax=Trichinella patagoniensis TaxID=990121 RepID=A0A0V0YTR8_9BILA|nr:hypothetical protein T06_13496 [Trichinella sp. T6]KRX30541.1 hypothetical protein T09_1566 [Trichinella sp. T9]KRY03716.1 hypothetical protein T12_8837 [Trichinella patagoniensis]KRY03722.1 hypothetical protein T12_12107 [Trichinella patagoniensis]KRY03926.1 hypothetical protein T12_4638 [Trichinella patagoniensis]
MRFNLEAHHFTLRFMFGFTKRSVVLTYSMVTAVAL